MKLLTKELQGQFPKLYETEGTPTEEKKVIAKFFTPPASARVVRLISAALFPTQIKDIKELAEALALG